MSQNLSKLRAMLKAEKAGIRCAKLTPSLLHKQLTARVREITGGSCAECWGEDMWEDQMVAMCRLATAKHCLYGRLCDCGCGALKWAPLRRHSDALPGEGKGFTVKFTLITPPPPS